VVERLQQKKFSSLDQSETSSIIHRCWHGSFDTIQQLFGSDHGARRGEEVDHMAHIGGSNPANSSEYARSW